MTLKDRILEAVKTAMRAGDKPRLGALRLVTAALKQKEVDERCELDDTAVLAVLEKMLKQRRESESQYRQAGRDDLAAREAFEIDIINEFMPPPLSAEALAALIDEAVAAVTEPGPRAMGQVMAALKPHIQGRADPRQVSALVRQRLGG
mgnify:CR=1 FL=1